MSKYLLIIFILFGCGKFNYSPYISNTANTNHNYHALKRIAARDGLFTSNFKVAVISDTHDYYSELHKTIKHINARKDEYAFVIITGDMTNIGLLSEFETSKKFYDYLEVPYIVTIGNHDLLTNGGEIFDQMFGEDTYSLDFKQSRFILYNNWESSYLVPDLDWIENELTSSTKTHNLLFSHVSADEEARFKPENITSLKNLVDANSVKYIVNGHDHNPTKGVFGSATRVEVGSSSKKVFLELIITNGGVNHAFIYP